MYINVTETMFKDEFKALRPDNFSYEGLSALYDSFIEAETSGQTMELDVIAICCEFSESHYLDILDDYGVHIPETDDKDEVVNALVNYLNDNTLVVAVFDDTILYQNF